MVFMYLAHNVLCLVPIYFATPSQVLVDTSLVQCYCLKFWGILQAMSATLSVSELYYHLLNKDNICLISLIFHGYLFVTKICIFATLLGFSAKSQEFSFLLNCIVQKIKHRKNLKSNMIIFALSGNIIIKYMVITPIISMILPQLYKNSLWNFLLWDENRHWLKVIALMIHILIMVPNGVVGAVMCISCLLVFGEVNTLFQEAR